MTQEELKSLAKEYLGKWVSFRNDSKELCTTTFIKPVTIKTYPPTELHKEIFLLGPTIKIDKQYQLEGLQYSVNGYVVISTPALKAVFPTEEQIVQFENIINIYDNLNTNKTIAMITEDYVHFETAKLLAEKGFDGICETSYYISNDGCENVVSIGDFAKVRAYRSGLIAAPTLQMACKWLREKFDLHIIAYPFKTDNPTSVKHYCCRVYKTFNLLGYEKYENETLTSYEEAVETALNYCLNNLIK